uniref:MamL-1 domain-containing protein n=2 Tax=Macrostomum lignano TaxID=282301 RepID=A0A1I8J2Z1_9PLAT
MMQQQQQQQQLPPPPPPPPPPQPQTHPSQPDPLVHPTRSHSKAMAEAAAVSRMASMEAQLAHLTSWIQQSMQHQHQHQQHQKSQHSPGAVKPNAPSNSSLDSAFSAQSTNSDQSCLGAAQQSHRQQHQQRTSPHLADGLRRMRAEAVRLRRDFQNLRSEHNAGVRHINEMFEERRQRI